MKRSVLSTLRLIRNACTDLRRYPYATNRICYSTVVDVEPIDNIKEQKIKLIKMELETERLRGNIFVPDSISDKHWSQLVDMPGYSQRMKFYRYLKMTEFKNAHYKEQHMKNVEKNRSKLSEMNTGAMQYGIMHNSLFMRVRPACIKKIYNMNLIQALQFGQKIAIDLSFVELMNQKELNSAINQIKSIYSFVRQDRDAFCVHLCNADVRSDFIDNLKQTLPFLNDPNSLVKLTEASYLDLFPKEKLVYLAPKCGEDLEYDFNDIYILGGFVDKCGQGYISQQRAERDGIRVAQLPLDKYLDWRRGTKCLAFSLVVKILATMKDTGDWKTALRYVPKNKICTDQEHMELKWKGKHLVL